MEKHNSDLIGPLCKMSVLRGKGASHAISAADLLLHHVQRQIYFIQAKRSSDPGSSLPVCWWERLYATRLEGIWDFGERSLIQSALPEVV